MCFGSAQKAPAPEPVQAPPTREQVAAEAAFNKGMDTLDVVNESKDKVAKRQGVYADIKTSRSGDTNYGSNAQLAKFGSTGKTTGTNAKFGSA